MKRRSYTGWGGEMKTKQVTARSERRELIAAFQWVWPHVNMRAVYLKLQLAPEKLDRLSAAEWFLLKAELDAQIELARTEGRVPRSLVGFTTRLRRPGE